MDLVIRGGTVVTPDGKRETDVGVDDGKIIAVGDVGAVGAVGEIGAVGKADIIIDARGKLVLPGAIDVHTHLRLPTDDYPERFFHDTRAAAVGGTTTVLTFAEQPRGGSPLETLREWRAKTATEAAGDYGIHIILTDLSERAAREIPEVIDAGCPTFKAFMVYDELMIPDGDLYQAIGIATRNHGMMMVHCENQVMLSAEVAACIERGDCAPRFHASSRPPVVEAEATHRALCMAEMTSAPLYIVHMSCAASVRHVEAARRQGQPVFAETCPHYLTLTDECYSGSDERASRFVISPPLRATSDRDALWQALADGILDVVGSDHVPRRLETEKDAGLKDFRQIPNGAPGIETMPTLVYSEGVARQRISIERMVELVATTPARLFGLESKGSIAPGKDADIVIWDPEAARTITQNDLHHSSDFTPYEGLQVRGAVVTTLLRGKIVAKSGRFVGRRGGGRFIERRLSPDGVTAS